MSECLTTEDQRTLLLLLSNSLFGGDMPNDLGDLAAVWREAVQQTVVLLALKNMDASMFPPQIRDSILRNINNNLARNYRLARGHAELSALLMSEKIPHVLIKGYASALWYPEPELRQMGDVDFIVAPEDVARAEALLKTTGYEPEKMSHDVHHVFKKNGCRYELHFAIPGVPSGAKGDRCRAAFRDLFTESEIRSTSFGDMRVPSPYHHGLILLLHTAHHLTNSGIGLRHLCDWAVFIANAPRNADLQMQFTQTLRALGLYRFARSLTDLCVLALGCLPPTPTHIPDREIADAMLEDILESGNFGQKDASRTRQAYMITSGTETDSVLKRMYTLLGGMVRQKWPTANAHPLLIPVGIVWFSFVYLLRAAAGKRPKPFVREALRGARKRTILYDCFQLFEPEEEKL